MLLRKCCTFGLRTVAKRYMASKPHIVVHPEIQRALSEKQPIVALESTIITHGMPLPQNVETALQVEQVVREQGALPATIGILDGCIKVGLTEQELIKLASKPRAEVIKCSRRDLPYVVAAKQSGGTTVAATMLIAKQAGIQIFATGGIGGVHRQGENTLDISADLVELGRTPVAVICSGVKSILDVPRTLEFLETQGVCVASYESPGGNFPDFYTQDSGCQVPYNLSGVQEAAELLRAWQQLELQSGVLIGVPIPKEFAANKAEIEAAIVAANEEARKLGVSGKEVTPFLLAKIAKITKGSSLQSNIALIKNNAKVAAQIACAWRDRVEKEQEERQEKEQQEKEQQEKEEEQQEKKGKELTTKQPLVIGASILDLSFRVQDAHQLQLNGATYKSGTQHAAGGVARNIAEGIWKLHGNVQLISALGNDYFAQLLRQLMPAALQANLIVNQSLPTSICSVIFDQLGDCKLILGDMQIHDTITPQSLQKQSQLFRQAPLIILDSNLSLASLECSLELAALHKKPIFFEPTDMFIAGKPFKLKPQLTQHIRLLKPNLAELQAIVTAITGEELQLPLHSKLEQTLLLQNTKTYLQKIDSHFNCIIATLGNHGVLLSIRSDALQDAQQLLCLAPAEEHTTIFYAPPKLSRIVNDSGAGDSFCAGFITALLREHSLDACVAAGFAAAEQALLSESAVPAKYFQCTHNFDTFSKEILDKLQRQCI